MITPQQILAKLPLLKGSEQYKGTLKALTNLALTIQADKETAQKVKSIGFADWITKQGFTPADDMWRKGISFFDTLYTTEDLYDIYNLPFNTRNKMLIKDVSDFNCVASDMVTEFMESLGDNPEFTLHPTQDDLDAYDGEDISWIYNSRAMDLCERYVKRLTAVGAKYFNEAEIDISTGVIEP